MKRSGLSSTERGDALLTLKARIVAFCKECEVYPGQGTHAALLAASDLAIADGISQTRFAKSAFEAFANTKGWADFESWMKEKLAGRPVSDAPPAPPPGFTTLDDDEL